MLSKMEDVSMIKNLFLENVGFWEDGREKGRLLEYVC